MPWCVIRVRFVGRPRAALAFLFLSSWVRDPNVRDGPGFGGQVRSIPSTIRLLTGTSEWAELVRDFTAGGRLSIFPGRIPSRRAVREDQSDSQVDRAVKFDPVADKLNLTGTCPGAAIPALRWPL